MKLFLLLILNRGLVDRINSLAVFFARLMSTVNINKRLELRLREHEDEYLTYKQFPIFVGTFNVNNRQPPANTLLEEWLFCGEEKDIVPEIIAVGFQEIDTSGGAYIFDDRKKEDEWETIVRRTIQKSLISFLKLFCTDMKID